MKLLPVILLLLLSLLQLLRGRLRLLRLLSARRKGDRRLAGLGGRRRRYSAVS